MISLCIERMTLSLSATFATRGNSSQKCMPGTFVRMGSNSPRISSGASGFGSKVSCCGGPPPRKRIIQDLARPKEPDSFESWLANRSPKETPRHPSPPNRNHSRRLRDIPDCRKDITKKRLNRQLVSYNLELITKCCCKVGTDARKVTVSNHPNEPPEYRKVLTRSSGNLPPDQPRNCPS